MKKLPLRNRVAWIMVPIVLALVSFMLAQVMRSPVPRTFETTVGTTDAFRLRERINNNGRTRTTREFIEFAVPVGGRVFRFNTGDEAIKRELQRMPSDAKITVTHTNNGELWGLQVNERVFRTPSQYAAEMHSLSNAFLAAGAGLLVLAATIAIFSRNKPVAEQPARRRRPEDEMLDRFKFNPIEGVAALLWGWIISQVWLQGASYGSTIGSGFMALFAWLGLLMLSGGICGALLRLVGELLGGSTVARIGVGLAGIGLAWFVLNMSNTTSAPPVDETVAATQVPAPTQAPVATARPSDYVAAPTQSPRVASGPPGDVPRWFYLRKVENGLYETTNTTGETMYVIANLVIKQGDGIARCPIAFENKAEGGRHNLRKGKLAPEPMYQASLLKDACSPAFDRGAWEMVVYSADGVTEMFKTSTMNDEEAIACKLPQCRFLK